MRTQTHSTTPDVLAMQWIFRCVYDIGAVMESHPHFQRRDSHRDGSLDHSNAATWIRTSPDLQTAQVDFGAV